MPGENETSPKRDALGFGACAVLLFVLTMVNHPIIQSFFWINLGVAFFCLYRVGVALRKLWRS